MKHAQYFDGRVQSLELSTPDGRATVGVIEPGTYTFPTSSEEHITIIEGEMRVKLPGAEWRRMTKGDQLVVKAGISFDVDAGTPTAYICFYR